MERERERERFVDTVNETKEQVVNLVKMVYQKGKKCRGRAHYLRDFIQVT